MTASGKPPSLPNWSRAELNNELFRRPPVPLATHALVVRAAFLQTAEEATQSVNRLRNLLGRQQDTSSPGQGNTFELIEFGGGRFQWERHTEFTTYALIIDAGGETGNPFNASGVAGLPSGWPNDWIAEITGEQIAATRLQFLPSDETTALAEARSVMDPQCASSMVADGKGRIWVDSRIKADGCTRILIEDHGMGEDRRARLAQRLIEIEIYRMMAMLAFPPARQLMADLHQMESGLRELVMRVAADDDKPAEDAASDAESMLHELLALAAEVERVSAVNGYRFDASRAYFDIVEQRLDELKETRIPGHQRLSNFLKRRLGPAMETVAAVRRRLENLSGHIDHTASLIRTRVDLDLQRQNRSLLHSMDRRAALQLRLQATLEWLSLMAMSYYGIGIVLYMAEAAYALGAPVAPKLVAGLAAPVVIGVAWWIVHQVRKLLKEHGED